MQDEIYQFLYALARHPKGANRKALGVADRKADKARQTCRRNQWAVYTNMGDGDRWHLTDKGREELSRIKRVRKHLDKVGAKEFDVEWPLPEWAERRASNGYRDLLSALPTKDGRRIGNAVIARHVQRHGVNVSMVVTDAGNILHLTEGELEYFFHPPELIMKSLLPQHEQAVLEWDARNKGAA